MKGKVFAVEDFVSEARKATKASRSLVGFNPVFLFYLGLFLLKYKAGGASHSLF